MTMIVIEGMDNSGKSTLGEAMAEYMDMIVQESEGPPLSDDEINQRVDKYHEMEGRLFVRHPCISNEIYGSVREEGNPITLGRTQVFYEARPIIVYCDAMDRGMDDHILKDHDTERHQGHLKDHYDKLLERYRLWAAQRANFIYRIGDDMDELIVAVDFVKAYREA